MMKTKKKRKKEIGRRRNAEHREKDKTRENKMKSFVFSSLMLLLLENPIVLKCEVRRRRRKDSRSRNKASISYSQWSLHKRAIAIPSARATAWSSECRDCHFRWWWCGVCGGASLAWKTILIMSPYLFLLCFSLSSQRKIASQRLNSISHNPMPMRMLRLFPSA